MTDSQVAQLLAAAGEAQHSGRPADATRLLEQVLALDPANAPALNTLGMMALGAGDAAGAELLFARAAAADPAAAALWMNLATARRAQGDDAGEGEALARALGTDQRNFMALVRTAELHERLGETTQALQRWSAVHALAERIEPRPTEVEHLRARAAAFIAASAASLAVAVDRDLKPALDTLAASERRRFDACVDHALGRRAIYRNACDGLHYPFLPADEFFDRDHFPWLARIEAQTGAIRAELEAFLAGGGDGLEPYVAMERGMPQTIWTALDHSLDWSALHLWRHGARNEAACARFPVTAAALDALPLARMPRRTPTAFFSILKPGTRLPPHTGVSNTRAIIHLPLIVPEGCGFRVGGETRRWTAGEALAFDDTIEHEAWNDSAALRAILIFDTWNPHLTEVERGLLQRYFAIADATGNAASVAD